MIKNIVKDNFALSLKAKDATKDDAHIILDLIDTLNANKEHCVGLAANMIGYNKRILVARDNQKMIVMQNPCIIKKAKLYQIREKCLSHDGMKDATRFETIVVTYLDEKYNERTEMFYGFIAQIIQHEMDHFEGILI